MRNLFGLLAIVALLLFLVASIQLVSSWNEGFYLLLGDGEMTGWEDTGVSDIAYQALHDSFGNRITALKGEVNRFTRYGLVASFAMTLVSGLSTLLSSISAAKAPGGDPARTMRVVAILTFLVTLMTWGNSQLDSRRNDLEKELQEVKGWRQEFEVRYGKENDAGSRNRLIKEYERKLD